ncbi:DUF3311 domain-containing protein [Microbacterium sp. SYP-A9085]|jgi:hypothetical protein|uniref:DUF3311 domain-containing protein n=1 Tax=Microbacterium sp. SYP-A9085 TaxID=2664454 RepID=UPI00129AD823|nr:DUF3311 domain-containing protein [Microbacterium sp. SYP-A9085]MRH28733.1 DUF3311 domain-containing protein [Microbacterium sp. SYP-A9085]
MTSTDTPTRGPARPGPYIVSGILIVLAIVMPLLIPTYARWDPALWDIPFFFWYQLIWVFLASGLLSIAYLLMRKEDRRRRAAVRDGRDA